LPSAVDPPIRPVPLTKRLLHTPEEIRTRPPPELLAKSRNKRQDDGEKEKANANVKPLPLADGLPLKRQRENSSKSDVQDRHFRERKKKETSITLLKRVFEKSRNIALALGWRDTAKSSPPHTPNTTERLQSMGEKFVVSYPNSAVRSAPSLPVASETTRPWKQKSPRMEQQPSTSKETSVQAGPGTKSVDLAEIAYGLIQTLSGSKAQRTDREDLDTADAEPTTEEITSELPQPNESDYSGRLSSDGILIEPIAPTVSRSIPTLHHGLDRVLFK
jgi:hypothetical protein